MSPPFFLPLDILMKVLMRFKTLKVAGTAKGRKEARGLSNPPASDRSLNNQKWVSCPEGLDFAFTI